jgi:hypothetical protein
VAGNPFAGGSHLLATFTLDTAPPSIPPAPDLQAGSDLGISDTDNVTSDNTPTFQIDASPYFRVYRDGIQVSGDRESGTTFTVSPQPDGTFVYTVTAVDGEGRESAFSEPLVITIDTEGPSLIDVGESEDGEVEDTEEELGGDDHVYPQDKTAPSVDNPLLAPDLLLEHPLVPDAFRVAASAPTHVVLDANTLRALAYSMEAVHRHDATDDRGDLTDAALLELMIMTS